ncbi:zinc finger protein 33B-like isoform X3 [Protopterus annectens]|uniref:zinc finger protein 33B-like isoform X3 n=1 Tax=Protopterus annectens TaxID=7888 RepID=UPI001CF9336A|nr:zinc finger protein 33B-like isoform X3 [Protopterus annectens]
MTLTVPESFDDVTVAFSEEEWTLLTKKEKDLYKEVMQHNYETMISVGYNIPLKQLMLLLKGHEEASHVNIRVEEAEQQKDNLQDISTICRYTESKENWIQHSSFGRNHVYHGAKQTSEVQKGCYPHFTSIQQKSLKEERNYETSKCDKSIPVKERVIPHQQIHKVPYKCADCNRSFYKKCNLVMHRRVHWGTKPLEYAECNKTTDQKKLCEGYQLGCLADTLSPKTNRARHHHLRKTSCLKVKEEPVIFTSLVRSNSLIRKKGAMNLLSVTRVFLCRKDLQHFKSIKCHINVLTATEVSTRSVT